MPISTYGPAEYGVASYGEEANFGGRPENIHGILSTYFGDREFDVGKSVRRNSLFVDTEYIMDLGAGSRTRALVVDWADSFPDAQSGYYQSLPKFFDPGGPAAWRQSSFEQADAAWGYLDEDWVVFVDGTEGLSCDETVPRITPGQELINPNVFRPWIEAEIVVTGGNQISLPIYAFIGNSPVWLNHLIADRGLQQIIDIMAPNAENPDKVDLYLGLTKDELQRANLSTEQTCYQQWTRAGWSPRLFKVSTLRNSSFDWTSIDKFATTAPADAATTGMAVTSYAYARWSQDPARIDRTVQRPMTEADDIGWTMRQKMSRVRPVAGLPFDNWSSADTAGRSPDHDTPAEAMPPATPVSQEFSSSFNHSFSNFAAVVPSKPGASWGNYGYLQALYPSVIRANPREGLFFLENELGPAPWNFYTGQPAFSPAQLEARAKAKPYQQDRPAMPASVTSTKPSYVLPANDATTTIQIEDIPHDFPVAPG